MVAGCTTEGCVESTVRDACFYDYFPLVVRDCVGSDVPALHEASMLVMTPPVRHCNGRGGARCLERLRGR